MKKAYFQSFEDSSDRDAGPDRLLLLQAELKKKKLLGYLVPRTDVYRVNMWPNVMKDCLGLLGLRDLLEFV